MLIIMARNYKFLDYLLVRGPLQQFQLDFEGVVKQEMGMEDGLQEFLGFCNYIN